MQASSRKSGDWLLLSVELDHEGVGKRGSADAKAVLILDASYSMVEEARV